MRKKQNILMLIALFGLIAITAGVTYAFFSYAKEGTTDNTLTTGTITFLYTETSEVGRGIMLKEAYPISDSQGKNLTGEGNVFDFKITSSNTLDVTIPYEITARKKSNSTLDEEAVRIYLTKVNGTEEEVLLDNYSELDQTDKVDSSKHVEKTLHKGKVPANEEDYNQEYRLRMWVDKDIKFSPDENNNYPYNDKTFTITVNVYANAKVVTDEEIENASKAEISNITIGDTELTKVENEQYDYETSLPEGTTETTIDIETNSPDATVTVERLDSLAYSSNVKRLSTKKTLELLPGDNYFKITVISENKEVENEFTLKISVKQGEILLSDAIFNTYTTIYENPTLDKTSEETNENGLYKSTATNSGDPTYYFRGNVENYVDFAGFTWRVVRINEDGTIRLIMQEGINNNNTYHYNTSKNGYKKIYYSNSNVKTQLDSWYSQKIDNNPAYSQKVATGDYYCEQAKVKVSSTSANNASIKSYSLYTPDFTCKEDGNGYGIINSNVGLITYDEVIHSGAYYNVSNTNYYLYNSDGNIHQFWTMSPIGVNKNDVAYAWFSSRGNLYEAVVNNSNLSVKIRPVINLKSDVKVTGTGVSDDHWVVQ